MVNFWWAGIAASMGMLIYLLIAFMAFLYPIEIRHKVGRWYLKMAGRCFKQFTFLRRVLSGYDVLPISVDPEQKLLKLTLKSKTLREDKEYPFKDPDNRIMRLFNKPVAIAYEEVPAAIDAELAELGYWLRQKALDEGLYTGNIDDPEQYDDITVDPYLTIPDHLRLVDPIDVFELVPNSINPENIKTAENLTRQRFSKYGRAVGLEETVGTIMGFMAGVGGYAVLQYVRQNLLDGAGGGAIDNPLGGVTLGNGALLPPPDVVAAAVDVVVVSV